MTLGYTRERVAILSLFYFSECRMILELSSKENIIPILYNHKDYNYKENGSYKFVTLFESHFCSTKLPAMFIIAMGIASSSM